jgi:acyl carrier protein
MDIIDKAKLRAFLKSCLAERADLAEFQDDESLFSSGRLDSLTMTRVVIFLEQEFGVDFAQVNFDVDLIDSVQAIESLISNEVTH